MTAREGSAYLRLWKGTTVFVEKPKLSEALLLLLLPLLLLLLLSLFPFSIFIYF